MNSLYNIKIINDYGIIFISGDGYSLYKITKSSNHYNYIKLYNESVTLAKKHNKGGQSALRFSRLQEISEQNYITKVSEKVIETFIKSELKITKIFIIGNAGKKNLLEQSEIIQTNFTKIFNITIESINSFSINNYLTHDIKKVIMDYENELENNQINKLNELIQINPDKLYFGLDEIIKNLSNIKELYYDESLDIPHTNSKIKLYPVKKVNMEYIGVNCVGIKYYYDDLFELADDE